MNIACTVCYEILKTTDNIHTAPCGHLLHYHCWLAWLQRSQNCPECRKPTKPCQLIKLFFNTGDGDDYCTLKNKYDSLRCELQCKISEFQTVNALVEKQKSEIRDIKLASKREWDRFRKEIEVKRQKRLHLKRKQEELEHRLRERIKILKRQNESIKIESVKCQETKATEEAIFKRKIQALKFEKKLIQRSKDEELERLKEEQKANLQFLKQFSKGSEKIMEKLQILRRTEKHTEPPIIQLDTD